MRTISQLYFQSGSYNQTTCQYANCIKLRQCNPCGPTQTFTLVCPIPLVCKRLEDNHAGGMRVIMEVHTISLLYFKQADTTKQPTAIQTVTMQPMWCNPNINTYLFNSTGLHEGWKKFTQLEYGNECRCAPSHSFFLSRQLQPNNLPVCKLYQIVTMQPMWSNPNINIACPIPLGCKRLEDNHAGGMRVIMEVHSYHFTAILPAGRYNETTYRYSN